MTPRVATKIDRKTDQKIRQFVVDEICPGKKKPETVWEIMNVENGIKLIKRFLEKERKFDS